MLQPFSLMAVTSSTTRWAVPKPVAYLGQLDGSQPRRLLDADAPAVYASSGHLRFVRQGTVFAHRFDPGRVELTGNPFTVAERVPTGYGPPLVALSASAAGPFVYRSSSGVRQRFAWFDPVGKRLAKVQREDHDNCCSVD